MERKFHDELKRQSLAEPYAQLLDLQVVDVQPGTAVVRMKVRPELENIFGVTHGGAVFSLIDEAFQLASNTHGLWSVALNVSITYLAPPEGGTVLEAKAVEMHKTKRTSSYLCEVRDAKDGKFIATAQALAYRTGKEIRF